MIPYNELFQELNERLAATPELAGFDLLQLAKPSVRLVAQRSSSDRIEPGQSRIGGWPDVPPDFEWPRWAPTHGPDRFNGSPRLGEPVPLSFIAQLDLSALPRIDDDLPDSGWIYFFYDRHLECWGFDPVDRGCCRVMYVDCARAALKPAPPPKDADPEHASHLCTVEASIELTLPEEVPGMGYGSVERDAYGKLCDELSGGRESWMHRLLGHPEVIQNPMELECQLASNGIYCGSPEGYDAEKAKLLAPGAADWRLLLQIDTDEEGPGWMWGDVGRIYFWIKRQDLSQRCFDRSWLILQCC